MSKVTIQILVFPNDSTSDQPSTLNNRQWGKAICYLAELSICSCIFWGCHLEDQNRVTLLTDWGWEAKVFLTEHYALFAALLAPLLADPPDPPYVANLNYSVAECALYPVRGGLTTLSKLTYSSLSEFHRFHLLPPTFEHYHRILARASMEEDERVKGYRDGTAAWAMDGTTEREDQCEKMLKADDGTILKELCLREYMLSLADDEEVYHVVWNMLIPETVKKWKDSENEVWEYLYGHF